MLKEDSSALDGEPISRVECIEGLRGAADSMLTLFQEKNETRNPVFFKSPYRKIASKRVDKSRLSLRKTDVNGSPEKVDWFNVWSVLRAS